MWRYNQQIVVRWLSFIAGAMALAAGVFLFSQSHPGALTQLELKAELTRLSVNLEFQPLWVWPAAFAAITISFLIGLPSAIVFCLLYPLTGFLAAFFTVFLCQVFTTYLAMLIAWRNAGKGKLEQQLSPALKALIGPAKESEHSFAFWSRVYYSFPLRTIDQLTPAVHPDEKPFLHSLFPAAAAIFLRLLIPALWCESLLILIQDVPTDPGMDSARFLLWSSALVAYTLIPRVPELFICPQPIKPVLEKIETAPPAKTDSLDSEITLVDPKLSQKAKPANRLPQKTVKQPQPQTNN